MFFRVGVDDGASSVDFFRAGFHIGFSFCTVSVQFGNGSYCDNRFNERQLAFDSDAGGFFCANAEVAFIDHDGEFLKGWPHSEECDTVSGWLTTEQVLDVLVWARNYRPAPQLAVTPPFPQFDFTAAS